MKKSKLKLVILGLLSMPILLIAQQSQNAMSAVESNGDIMAQLAQLLPMGINPYATIFLTSVLSKLGIHNSFVATNPFFDNWIILFLFGALFLFTALVGTVVKTNKATAVVGLADNYLSNHAAILINVVVMLAPAIFSNSGQGEVMQEASFLSVGLKTLLIIAVSVYFLLVVTTVRFFIDILIFLTPIPFIDSILEIVKIALTVVFIGVSVFYPTLSVVFSVIVFIIALSMYRRSLGLVSKTTYFFIHPVINMFKNKEKLLTKNNNFSISVYLNENTEVLKKGTIARLEEREDAFYLVKQRFLFSKKEEKIDFGISSISLSSLKFKIIDEVKNVSLSLNRSYRKHYNEITDALGIENTLLKEKATLNSGKGFLTKVKNMFDKEAVEELKLTD